MEAERKDTKGLLMIRIDLTAEEAEMLRESLESYFSDLRMEIPAPKTWLSGKCSRRRKHFCVESFSS
jgi:hypothetical protein